MPVLSECPQNGNVTFDELLEQYYTPIYRNARIAFQRRYCRYQEVASA